jgi:hypothetical protein
MFSSGIFTSLYRPDFIGSLFPGLIRPGFEADHSPPMSRKIKKSWITTSTPPYVLMTWCLVIHKELYTCLPFTRMMLEN